MENRERVHSLSPDDYPIVIMADLDGGYIAVCPSFRNCLGRGESRHDALDAASFNLNQIVDRALDAGRDLPPTDPMVAPVLPDEIREKLARLDGALLKTEDRLGRWHAKGGPTGSYAQAHMDFLRYQWLRSLQPAIRR